MESFDIISERRGLAFHGGDLTPALTTIRPIRIGIYLVMLIPSSIVSLCIVALSDDQRLLKPALGFVIGLFAYGLWVIYKVRRDAHPDRGPLPPVVQYFILALFFFYVMRVAAYLFLEDNDLMASLGVIDPWGEMTKVLGWLSQFLTLMLAGYLVGIKLRCGERSLGGLLKWLYCRKPLVRLERLTLIVAGLLTAVACSIYMFMISGVVGKSTAGVFDNYVLMAPNAFYGLCLIAWAFLCYRVELPAIARSIILCIFLFFIGVSAYYGREILSSRIYYMAPVAMFILSYIPRRLSIWMLFLGGLIVFPILNLIGATRVLAVSEAKTEAVAEARSQLDQGAGAFLLAPYAAHGGDFTCADIFASALSNEITHRPYGLSYLYIFVHFIPRQFWPGKPVNGVLTDQAAYMTLRVFGSDAQEIPYTPGIVGDLFVEGGVGFIFIGGFLWGLMFSAIDNALGWITAVLAGAPRIYAIFALISFLEFFVSRLAPYQTFVNLIFLTIGMWLGSLIFPDSIPRVRPSTSSVRP